MNLMNLNSGQAFEQFIRCGLVIATVALTLGSVGSHAAPKNIAPLKEHRIALVIGNNKYAHATVLANAVNDAAAIAIVLRKSLNFEVVERHDADKASMEEAIREFASRIRENSVALVYYSGHGIQVADRNYLLPIDFSGGNPRDAVSKLVDVSLVIKQMASKKGTVKIVILDACRDDPLKFAQADFIKGLSPMSDSPARTFIAFATSPGKIASDGAGSNGVYTDVLLKVLEKPGLLIEDVFRQVRQGVMTATNDRQIPWESSSMDRPWYFRPLAKADDSSFRRVFRDCDGCTEMVGIPAGTLSAPNGLLSKVSGFAIGKYEVTFEEWDACVSGKGCDRVPKDEGWGRGRQPVININWNDAQQYVDWLSKKTGKKYRLPTEVEWEYAARAGTKSQYYWGNEAVKELANCLGCSSRNVRIPAVIGSYPPNPSGLYDMAGNVWEWVQDCWSPDFPPPKGANKIEEGISACKILRPVRGGAFDTRPSDVTVSFRNAKPLKSSSKTIGFRVARDL